MTAFYKIAIFFVSMALILGCGAVAYILTSDRQEPQGAAVSEPLSTNVPQELEILEYIEEVAEEPLEDDAEVIPEEPADDVEIIDDVYILKNSARFKSTGAGAHYYVYSDYGNTYSEASANVLLPTGFENNHGARNGYISLGITGSVHGIDVGIGNTGSGWFPYAYDVGAAFTTYKDYLAPETATNAIISVKPVDTETVHMYVDFLDASGHHVGRTFDCDIKVTGGNLVMQDNKIMCRFYRFASLVPVGEDDQSDGTYMTGGRFTQCRLYNGTGHVSWGIDTDRVTDAWEISSSKISVSYTTYHDTFDIHHN